MSGHPIPVYCGEAEGHVVGRNSSGWVAVRIAHVNDGLRFRVGGVSWLRPSDLDVFGDERAELIAGAPIVTRQVTT